MTRAWTWRNAILSTNLQATTKHVLMVISTHMNDMGGGCYPSVKTIAELASLSERSVCTHVEIAAKAGWLAVEKHGFNGQGWARHEYKALWPEGTESGSARQGSELRSEGTEPDDKKALNVVQSIEPPKEHSIEHLKSKPTKASRRGSTPAIRLDQFLQNSGGEPPITFGHYADTLGWTSEFAGEVWTKFCRYWRSADAKGGGVKRDWLSTWQNWCDRENGGRGRGSSGSPGGALASALRASVAGRYGSTPAGGPHHGAGGANQTDPDGAREADRLPIGQIPF